MRKTTYSLAAILAVILLLGVYFLITNGLKAEMAAGKADSTEVMRHAAEASQLQLQTEITDLKGRLVDSEQARDKMAKMLEDKIKDATNTENALQEDTINGKKREAELEIQRASMEERVSKLTVELNETQAQFTSLKESSMNEPAGESGRQVKLLRRELLAQEKKLAKITDLYARLKDELKSFADIINKKDDALAAKNKEIENLKAHLNEFYKDQAAPAEDNDPQKARADGLKKQVEVILQTQQ